MGHSHEHVHTADNTPLGKKHARVLQTVLAINGTMVVIEGVSGYLAHSTSMVADTLDMLSDALGASAGLFVNKRSSHWQAGAALAKAGVMGVLGIGVLAAAGFALFNPVLPVAAAMGLVGGLALAANATCVLLLYRYRNDNINIKSTLICTRNDMVSNVGVLLAAAVGHFLVSPLPDLIVGTVVAGLFIRSAVQIARESIAILRVPDKAHAENHDTHEHAAPHKAEPKTVLRFKKILRAVFNRKAADTAAPPAKPAVAAPVADKRSNIGP